MDIDRDALLAEDIERAAWWVRKLAKARDIRLSDLGPTSDAVECDLCGRLCDPFQRYTPIRVRRRDRIRKRRRSHDP